jgi:hypothetical protein
MHQSNTDLPAQRSPRAARTQQGAGAGPLDTDAGYGRGLWIIMPDEWHGQSLSGHCLPLCAQEFHEKFMKQYK